MPIKTKSINKITDILADQDEPSTWYFPAENKTISSLDILEKCMMYADYLKNKGIKPGDRVGFVLDNSYDYVCLLYATWRLHAVVVPLRPRSGRYHNFNEYIAKCDSICQFTYLIINDSSVLNVLKECATTQHIVIDTLSNLQSCCSNQANQTSFKPANSNMNDIAIIQFSSGSTGDPKGVVVTHAMMMSQLQNIQDNHQRSRGDKVAASASWLPINHDMGMFIGVLSPIFSGCDNILAPPSFYMKNPAYWFSLLAQHQVDFTFTTNSVLASTLNILKRLKRQQYHDLSDLHIYIAAEKVSPTIVRKTYFTLSEFNLKQDHLHIGYGMAENTLGATYTTAGPIKTHWFILTDNNKIHLCDANTDNAFELVSIGIPNDNHRITIRDQHDQILPDSTLGEISIQSPCVSPAYYNNPSLTEQTFTDHRLKTGDLGFHCAGEFYFYSRIDDLIVSGGRNIVPDDIEAITEELPYIRAGGSALLSYEDKQKGTVQLHLLVEHDARLDEESVREHCSNIRQHILNSQDVLIRSISLCEKGTIEKTSSGKKRRKVILQRLLNNNIILLPLNRGHQNV